MIQFHHQEMQSTHDDSLIIVPYKLLRQLDIHLVGLASPYGTLVIASSYGQCSGSSTHGRNHRYSSTNTRVEVSTKDNLSNGITLVGYSPCGFIIPRIVGTVKRYSTIIVSMEPKGCILDQRGV